MPAAVGYVVEVAPWPVMHVVVGVCVTVTTAPIFSDASSVNYDVLSIVIFLLPMTLL